MLLIIPDGTRTAPVGLMFRALHDQLSPVARAFDVLVALGTHPPMSEAAICRRLEITPEQRASTYASVRFFNHEWNNPAALRQIGRLTADEVSELTGGLFAHFVRRLAGVACSAETGEEKILWPSCRVACYTVNGDATG